MNERKLLDNLKEIIESEHITKAQLYYAKLQMAKLESSLNARVSNIVEFTKNLH